MKTYYQKIGGFPGEPFRQEADQALTSACRRPTETLVVANLKSSILRISIRKAFPAGFVAEDPTFQPTAFNRSSECDRRAGGWNFASGIARRQRSSCFALPGAALPSFFCLSVTSSVLSMKMTRSNSATRTGYRVLHGTQLAIGDVLREQALLALPDGAVQARLQRFVSPVRDELGIKKREVPSNLDALLESAAGRSEFITMQIQNVYIPKHAVTAVALTII